MTVINDCFLHGRYDGDACVGCLKNRIASLEEWGRHVAGAGPIMWTCDVCGFSCDIATEPLGTGDACIACENKEFRARLGIES